MVLSWDWAGPPIGPAQLARGALSCVHVYRPGLVKFARLAASSSLRNGIDGSRGHTADRQPQLHCGACSDSALDRQRPAEL